MSLLVAQQIHHSYGGTQALCDVSLEIEPGEWHALCGENGAGKSTLIKIISGVEPPDQGSVTLEGNPLPMGRVHAVEQAGVVAVHQEPVVFPHLSTIDNVFVGREPGRLGGLWLDRDRMARGARQVMHQLGEDLPLEQPVGELSLAQRQMVSIARALLNDCRILILDEPTASLSARETQSLFRAIKQLQAQGVGILYVSHRLEEIFQMADRVTVLRDGRMVGTHSIASIQRSDLIQMMVGRPLDASSAARPLPREEQAPALLEVQGLSRAGVFDHIDFAIQSGEILGLSGLVGAGRTEIARAIFGLDPIDTGSITLDGQPMPGGFQIHDAMDRGMALVPEDRQRQGLILPESVEDNLTLPSLKAFSKFLGLDRESKGKAAHGLIQRMGIKTAKPSSPAQSLSGGNQQKIVLGKWVYRQPRLFLLDEPTRGVDVGAKEEVHRMIRTLARSGSAILLISSDMPEILQLSDRILVLCQGRIRGEVTGSQATAEQLLEWALPPERPDAA